MPQNAFYFMLHAIVLRSLKKLISPDYLELERVNERSPHRLPMTIRLSQHRSFLQRSFPIPTQHLVKIAVSWGVWFQIEIGGLLRKCTSTSIRVDFTYRKDDLSCPQGSDECKRIVKKVHGFLFDVAMYSGVINTNKNNSYYSVVYVS